MFATLTSFYSVSDIIQIEGEIVAQWLVVSLHGETVVGWISFCVHFTLRGKLNWPYEPICSLFAFLWGDKLATRTGCNATST